MPKEPCVPCWELVQCASLPETCLLALSSSLLSDGSEGRAPELAEVGMLPGLVLCSL